MWILTLRSPSRILRWRTRKYVLHYKLMAELCDQSQCQVVCTWWEALTAPVETEHEVRCSQSANLKREIQQHSMGIARQVAVTCCFEELHRTKHDVSCDAFSLAENLSNSGTVLCSKTDRWGQKCESFFFLFCTRTLPLLPVRDLISRGLLRMS